MYKIHTYLLLIVFSLLLFIPGINKLPVIDRDEAHFAQASRQMLQTGNYFQIRFQNNTRFQKPPGLNWLQAASVKFFSSADANSIWPYRIVSTLGALFSVLLTYFFAARFVGRRVAVIAAALLASSLLLVVEAHMAVIDASLLSSVLLMQGSLWIIYQRGLNKQYVSWGWSLCFWLAMSYGLVLKGVTPLIGVLSIITLCLVEKRIDWLSGLRCYRGLVLFILLNIVWLLMVNDAEQSNYLLQMLQKDLLPKLQGGHESHGKPPLFHLAILPLTFWPGSLFLWSGIVYAWTHRGTVLVKFLLSQILPVWIFFEAMPTKLPQYVLPVFPTLALLCALGFDKQYSAGTLYQCSRIFQGLWAAISISLGISFVVISYLLMHQISLVGVCLLAIISILTYIALYYMRKGVYQRGLITVCTMGIVTFFLVFTQLLPQLKPLWVTNAVAELLRHKTINTHISQEKPLLVAGIQEPSLVFNLNTRWVVFTSNTNAMAQLVNDPSRLALLEATAQNWSTLPNNLAILRQLHGFNYSKGKWVTLILIGQKGALHDVVL